MTLWRLVRLWFGALVAILSALCMAQVPVPALTGHVVDLTHTLSAEQQSSLERTLVEFEARKGSQLAVLLVPSTQPEPIETFALRVAEQWQLGRKKVDDGAILVIAKVDRAVRIEVGYGLEGALNDATAKRIIDESILPRFKTQDFAGGISAGVEKMIGVVNGEPLPAVSAGALPGQNPFGNMTVIVLVGALLGFLLRAALGPLPGAIITAVIVGGAAWFLLGVVSMALMAGGITLFTTLIGLTGLLRARFGGRGGGPGSGPGGGFRGGGGGFGGGGSSGRW